jgi:E3 ubiquitin-protein ligase RNF144
MGCQSSIPNNLLPQSEEVALKNYNNAKKAFHKMPKKISSKERKKKQQDFLNATVAWAYYEESHKKKHEKKECEKIRKLKNSNNVSRTMLATYKFNLQESEQKLSITQAKLHTCEAKIITNTQKLNVTQAKLHTCEAKMITNTQELNVTHTEEVIKLRHDEGELLNKLDVYKGHFSASNTENRFVELLSQARMDKGKALDDYKQKYKNAYRAAQEKHNKEQAQTSEIQIPTAPPIPEEIVCTICYDVTISGEQQIVNPSSLCVHTMRTVCDSCIQRTIRMEINSKGNTSIKCCQKDCSVILTYNEVQKWAESDIFERFDASLTRDALERNSEFCWCSHTGCGSGQFHYGRNSYMVCHACKGKTCFTHRVVQHTGRTCTQYDADAAASEEVALIQAIDGIKRCPREGCGHGIEKNEGCMHMTCRCGHEFCWLCLNNWKDTPRHAPTCQRYTAPT